MRWEEVWRALAVAAAGGGAYSQPPAIRTVTPRYKPSDGYAGMALW